MTFEELDIEHYERYNICLKCPYKSACKEEQYGCLTGAIYGTKQNEKE